MVMTSPEIVADLFGLMRENVQKVVPDSDLVRRMWRSDRGVRDVRGVSKDAMVNIVPETCRERAFSAGEQCGSPQSIAKVLPEHDAESASTSYSYILGTLVNRVRS